MPLSKLAWHELPIWQRDNKYIRSGYRPLSGSFTYRYKAFIYIEAQKRSTLVQLSRYVNNKLIPPAVIVLSVQLALLAGASSPPEAMYISCS